MPKINIVITGSDLKYGIAYIKFIEVFQRYSQFEILINSKKTSDLTHYLPYYNVPEPKNTKLATAFFSHPAPRSKFMSSALHVDHAITMNKRYTKLLCGAGVDDTTIIVPGVEMNLFKIRNPQKRNRRGKEKLIVGFTGRPPITGRKSPEILDKIKELDFIDFRYPDGKLTENEIAIFYSNLDLIVSPSNLEGGPMAIIESLAVGVPSIYFSTVGIGDDFEIGTIDVPTGAFYSAEAFINRIIKFYETEEWLYWEQDEIMKGMRNQITDWRYFVEQHDKIWHDLITK